MKVIERSPARLVVGGWNVRAVVFGVVYAVLPVVFFVIIVIEQPSAIFMALFMAAIMGALLVRQNYLERIVFDRDAGEVRFEQRKLLGTQRRVARLNGESRIEIERVQFDTNNRPGRRLALVTDGERTPFSNVFYTKFYDEEQAMLTAWIAEAWGDKSHQPARRDAHA
ncbi:hypothetical protein [Amorphus sp. 3PC139-8]|uniref:hypothetical protein n=1 Tax=Amorphus sp. 3PC139-8 TaxID=2735676 RepID=UPI00345C76E3